MNAGLITLVVQGIGALIIAAALTQALTMLFGAWRRTLVAEQRHTLELDLLREAAAIAAARAGAVRERAELSWTGYRKFAISDIATEADDIASFYLTPHNHGAVTPYLPGQFLTFRFRLPGQPRPLVRCYSLSEAPMVDSERYRITVRRIAAPTGHPEIAPGVISNHLHENVSVGDLLDVAAPSGQFVIDPLAHNPVVLIAGGIGLTPLLSMVNAIARSGVPRETWLFYGLVNERLHVMKEPLERLAREHDAIHLRVFYSAPTEKSIEGRDYQHKGHVTIDAIRKTLTSSNYDFYVCGPSGMMRQITDGLRDWQVPESSIHVEAFGAAGVRSAAGALSTVGASLQNAAVTFDRSGKSMIWSNDKGSLLELAEANGVAIDFGCRAGNCGTCLTAIKSGEVAYIREPGTEPEPGSCLACIAVPKTTLVLDA